MVLGAMRRMMAITGLALFVWSGRCDRGWAQLLRDLPTNARGVTVEDRVGDFVPLDVMFNDERGQRVPIGKYFRRGIPIVLTLNYSDCPGLCIAQLDNLVGTLRELPVGVLGRDFEIITVSIDPRETPEKARRTEAKYVGLLGQEAEPYWHFLTGDYRSIQRLADSLGFRFYYDKANQRYNHPAATYFLSQDGRICRCLVSLGVEPNQFQLAVGEASQGRLTLNGLTDAFIQLCYYYDPDANRYTASARRVMAFGGAAFCLMLLGLTAPFWFRGRAAAHDDIDTRSAANGHVEPEGHGRTNGNAYNEVTISNSDNPLESNQ
ncbi:MAG: electron transporter [Pirellulaceae bacterium]|nr:MAG: electron transporter [Pirellulaceae bacterium]